MTDSLAPQLAAVFAEAVPGAPPMGLRERKKALAMRRIQQVAVEQFEEHGYDAVTIEQIARSAEVSPSSIYRYFGTKEGLVLRDEYDDLVLALAPRLFSRHDPWTAFARAVELVEQTHFVVDELSMRRMRLWHETPAVRAAGFVVLDETARQLAVQMHAEDRYGRSLHEYRILSSGMLAALFACLEQWYLEGGVSDLTRAVADALELIRPAWAT